MENNMKMKLLFMAIAALAVSKDLIGMQDPSKEKEIEVTFQDHIQLPNGHMRAIYEPLTKSMVIISADVKGRTMQSFIHDPLKFKNPETGVFENLRMEQIGGILSYKHYMVYVAICSKNSTKDTLFISRQNMITDDVARAWIHPGNVTFFEASSLYFSKNNLILRAAVLDKEKGFLNGLFSLNKKVFIPDDE